MKLLRPAAGVGCTTTVLSDPTLLGQPEYFVAVWTGNNIPATINETIGAEHTLGVGVSATGAAGSWSASGTTTVKTNTGLSTPTSLPTWFGNSVNYTKTKTVCAGNVTTYKLTTSGIAYPLDWSYTNKVAGQVKTTIYTQFCSQVKNPGSVPTTGLSTSRTVAGGVELGMVSLNATTTWSKGVDISWTPAVKFKQCFNSANGAAGSTDTEVHAA